MAIGRRPAVLASLLWMLGLDPGAIASAAPPEAACAGDPACERQIDEARTVASTLMSRLQQALLGALADGDVARAISACNQMAPSYTQQVSTERGWRVTRISLKPRNSLLGTPDAWEQDVLQRFDRAAATGVDPMTLEVAELVEEPQGPWLRYMKALPVQAPCLTCHGPAPALSDAVNSALQAQYPHDRATGYAMGDVRGAVSVKIPVDRPAAATTRP